jgi:hypothetical protein
MAIRPVDLQLAYMAAPQNAAVVNSAESAPQAAQQAASASFAAEVTRREEQIGEPDKAHGGKVRSREERAGDDDPRRQRRRNAPYEAESESAGPLGLAGDGEHFIDVTA